MQRLVGRVTGQIEDEIHDFAPCEHGTTGLSPGIRHCCDSGIDFGPPKERQLLIGVPKRHPEILALIHGLFYPIARVYASDSTCAVRLLNSE